MLYPESVIEKKQSGKRLSYSEIEFIVNGYTSGTISDKDMTHWIKAIFQKGMNHEETMDYTRTMLNSGAKLNFSYLPGYIVDKHSTGGVGDKVSLILGPLLAACGCYVPMLSGRGLEHTQGTIDKLETIPGYRSSLSLSRFQKIVEDVGISIMAQTEEICPADRKIYTLRDITGTVASFPLICGSIMSKKIAEGIQGLVLDIKVGNGAFIKTHSKAKELGVLLKGVGNLYGINVSTSFTDMNQPLGKTAGLWCEVMESIECLKGNGSEDLMAVVYHLGEEALKLAGIQNPEERLRLAISNGSAMDIFKQMVFAHGGLLESLNDPNTHQPRFREEVYAEKDGYISFMDTLSLGKAVVFLGGGRLQSGDTLDPSVGIVFHKKTGDKVSKGEPLVEYYCSGKDKFETGKLYFNEVVQIKPKPPELRKLIYR